MIRLIFLSVIVLHALVHVTVFLRHRHSLPYRPAAGKTIVPHPEDSDLTGLPWLASGILFLVATAFFLLLPSWFWLPATVALLLSQTLILLYWDEARLGTAVNVIVLVAAVLNAAAFGFDRYVSKEISVLRQDAAERDIIISEDMITGLPDPVQRWMMTSGVIGRRTPNMIRVEQRGTLRLRSDGDWMPFQAVQYFTIHPPAFVWSARVRIAPGLYIGGRDMLQHGKGNMLIRPLFLITAANSSGDEIDHGALTRFLAELAWFPQAAASDLLTWEAVNDTTATVRLRSGAARPQVWGTYFFDNAGRVTGFEAMRYGDFEGKYRKERWSISVNAHKRFDGVQIGSSSTVTWKLQGSDFQWLKLEITDVTRGDQ